MSQKNRKGGRPKGTPKTGGRKKGSRNKNNPRYRERFVDEGFDIVKEFVNNFKELNNPQERMDALKWLTAYMMPRLRQEEEAAAGALGGLASEIPDEKEISTADLLKLVKG